MHSSVVFRNLGSRVFSRTGLPALAFPKTKAPLLAQRAREKWGTRGRGFGCGLSLHDLLGGGIPNRHCFVEVGEVCQVAADGGVVAEDFVFGNGFTRAHGAVEVGLVI